MLPLLLYDSSAARGRLLSSFADGSVDVLFIDGLHTYSGVAGDLRAWWPKMHPHGLVIMNDMPNINFLDVTRAALDFFAWRPSPAYLWEVKGRHPVPETPRSSWLSKTSHTKAGITCSGCWRSGPRHLVWRTPPLLGCCWLSTDV